MATPVIKIKRKLSGSGAPSNGSLQFGELAADIASQRLYIGDSSGSPVMIGSGAAGTGTVQSVGLSTTNTSIFNTGTAVTTTGNLTFSLASQNANKVFAGPSSGASATPTFRTLVADDLATSPSDSKYLKYTTAGGLQWADATTPGASASGSTGNIQLNNAGVFSAKSNFTFKSYADTGFFETNILNTLTKRFSFNNNYIENLDSVIVTPSVGSSYYGRAVEAFTNSFSIVKSDGTYATPVSGDTIKPSKTASKTFYSFLPTPSSANGNIHYSDKIVAPVLPGELVPGMYLKTGERIPAVRKEKISPTGAQQTFTTPGGANNILDASGGDALTIFNYSSIISTTGTPYDQLSDYSVSSISGATFTATGTLDKLNLLESTGNYFSSISTPSYYLIDYEIPTKTSLPSNIRIDSIQDYEITISNTEFVGGGVCKVLSNSTLTFYTDTTYTTQANHHLNNGIRDPVLFVSTSGMGTSVNTAGVYYAQWVSNTTVQLYNAASSGNLVTLTNNGTGYLTNGRFYGTVATDAIYTQLTSNAQIPNSSSTNSDPVFWGLLSLQNSGGGETAFYSNTSYQHSSLPIPVGVRVVPTFSDITTRKIAFVLHDIFSATSTGSAPLTNTNTQPLLSPSFSIRPSSKTTSSTYKLNFSVLKLNKARRSTTGTKTTNYPIVTIYASSPYKEILQIGSTSSTFNNNIFISKKELDADKYAEQALTFNSIGSYVVQISTNTTSTFTVTSLIDLKKINIGDAVVATLDSSNTLTAVDPTSSTQQSFVKSINYKTGVVTVQGTALSTTQSYVCLISNLTNRSIIQHISNRPWYNLNSTLNYNLNTTVEQPLLFNFINTANGETGLAKTAYNTAANLNNNIFKQDIGSQNDEGMFILSDNYLRIGFKSKYQPSYRQLPIDTFAPHISFEQNGAARPSLSFKGLPETTTTLTTGSAVWVLGFNPGSNFTATTQSPVTNNYQVGWVQINRGATLTGDGLITKPTDNPIEFPGQEENVISLADEVPINTSLTVPLIKGTAGGDLNITTESPDSNIVLAIPQSNTDVVLSTGSIYITSGLDGGDIYVQSAEDVYLTSQNVRVSGNLIVDGYIQSGTGFQGDNTDAEEPITGLVMDGGTF